MARVMARFARRVAGHRVTVDSVNVPGEDSEVLPDSAAPSAGAQAHVLGGVGVGIGV